MQKFRELGAPPPDPRASSGWGLPPRPPKQPPSLQICGYAPAHKDAETCLPDDFISFFGTSTGALEILLNITPIEEFLLAEAVRGSYRITVGGLWHVNRVGSFGKTKCYGDVCNEVRKFLSLLQMPADRLKKTKVIKRNFEC